jgi:hypothetical protein
LQHLGTHWGKTLDETKQILLALLEKNDPKLETDTELKEMFETAAKAWGQPIEEAKKNAFALLKSQVKQ